MFGTVFSNDLILRKARSIGCRPSWERMDRETEPGKPYDMVIIDEGQDLNEDLLWGLVTLLRNPNGPPPDLLVLGDKLQSIYGYRGSDFRYLDYASQAYPANPARLWKSVTLDRSFRLPIPSANFINAFAGKDTIKAFRPGPSPSYIVVDYTKNVEELVDKLEVIINSMKAKDKKKEIAIIAPNMNGNHALATIANGLSKRGFYLARLDDSEASKDRKVLKGKIVIGTYHRFKGIESDLVIVLGVDSSLLRGEEYLDGCPNELFVALTRAREQIVAVQSAREGPIPGLDYHALQETAEVIQMTDKWPRELKAKNQSKSSRCRPIKVSRLVRHIPVGILEHAIRQGDLRITEVKPPSEKLRFPLIVPAGEYHEAVYDFGGLAVTAAFECQVAETCDSFDLKEEDIPRFCEIPASWFTRQATYFEAKMTNHWYRYTQLKRHTEFSWLDDVLPKAVNRIRELFPSTVGLHFEYRFVEKGVKVVGKVYNVSGSADIVEPPLKEGDPFTIYEIKVKSEISPDDVLQLALYGRLWTAKQRQTDPSTQFPRLILFNVTNGHVIEVQTSYEQADALLEKIIKARYHTNESDPPITDESFLQTCRAIQEKVENAPDISTHPDSKDGNNPLATWYTM